MRLGFAREHLSARVRELSGGQKRRLQLLLVLLSEPNLLILDEPSNDVDTDMLAAMEDLLDSWPGTLIVVSHDRYLLERATDQQYAIVDGRLRHLPGGVDQYLELRAVQAADARPRTSSPLVEPVETTSQHDGVVSPGSTSGTTTASAAEVRQARKDLARIERRLSRIADDEAKLHDKIAADPTNYDAVAELDAALRELAAEKESLELEWLEAAEIAG